MQDPLLDPIAYTKRLVLASINSIIDPLGIILPTTIRAKLFLHKLHNIENLNRELMKECRSISKQFNLSVKVK